MNRSRHVALLRGINVGGNNIIKMADLRAGFEAMGFGDVETYIQSGNVVFSSKPATKATLTTRIEKTLSEAFGYASVVVLVSSKELERVVAQVPGGFGKQPDRYRYDVMFVREPLTPGEALVQHHHATRRRRGPRGRPRALLPEADQQSCAEPPAEARSTTGVQDGDYPQLEYHDEAAGDGV